MACYESPDATSALLEAVANRGVKLRIEADFKAARERCRDSEGRGYACATRRAVFDCSRQLFVVDEASGEQGLQLHGKRGEA